MIYVMSDIHGKFDKFREMLDLIHFSKKDTLYILGDVLDRGEKPLDIIEYIIAYGNIVLLRGNHEQMFLNWYKGYDDCCWVQYNGGYTTVKQIEDKQLEVEFNYKKGLYEYLIKTPFYKIIEVKGNKFILVHAGLYFPEDYNNMDLNTFLNSQTVNDVLWSRDNIWFRKSYKDYITIQGHTTVQSAFNTNTIVRNNNNIYIDCGACFIEGKLACLRLDDMKEFYV